MAEHHKEVCRVCKTVVMECRCIGPNKVEIPVTCKACKEKQAGKTTPQS